MKERETQRKRRPRKDKITLHPIAFDEAVADVLKVKPQEVVMENVFQHIQNAVKSHKLPVEFRAAQVDSVLGIDYAGNFMAKHCQTGSSSHLFDRVSKGLYRIKE